ncbi:hypothetical protein AeMF1_002102 [Aphanomyces euteiches]|nr:hypothetical protein AeMF1_002102 [Aphanomyces euteiches]
MDADTSWDIMEDLGFLIATDEDLQADLAHVCDLLEETPSDRSALSCPASTETAVKTKKRQRVNHNKQEIRSLQKQVVALQEKLAHEKSRLKTTFSLSAWEQAARLEQVQAKRAIDENTELRAGIAEGTAFIQYMRSILQKKPRHLTMLSDPSSADWKEYKLAAQASLRVAAIHVIADRQYDRCMNVFIQAGVVGEKADVCRAEPVTLLNGQVVLEVVNHAVVPLPFRLAMDAVWKAFNGSTGPMLLDHASQETMEEIDSWTNYERFSQPQPNGTVAYTNTIRKRYLESDRDVVVFRNVLEDAIVPHMTRGSVDNMLGWMASTPSEVDRERSCHLTSVIHMPLESMEDSIVDRLVSTLASFSFTAAPTTLPPPSNVPHMQAFFDRAKMYHNAMMEAMQDAIAAFQKAN